LPRRDAPASRGSWRCPECGKTFAQRGQSHSCTVVPLGHHFENRPQARTLFDALRAAVEKAGGPFRLSIARTRIGFIDRMTFAAVMPRKQYLRMHFVLRRQLRSPRFVRVDHVAPYWVHVLEIHAESDIDAELCRWLGESYRTLAVVGNRTGRNAKP
jgi:hypothetical protein